MANTRTSRIVYTPIGIPLWWYIMGSTFSTAANYNSTGSAALNYIGNVDAPMAVFRQMIGRPRPQIREYSGKFNTKCSLSGITDNRILKNMSVGGSLRWSSKGAIGFYGLGAACWQRVLFLTGPHPPTASSTRGSLSCRPRLTCSGMSKRLNSPPSFEGVTAVFCPLLTCSL
jgi:hypothetical protein